MYSRYVQCVCTPHVLSVQHAQVCTTTQRVSEPGQCTVDPHCTVQQRIDTTHAERVRLAVDPCVREGRLVCSAVCVPRGTLRTPFTP
jgi:hypothetical protein